MLKMLENSSYNTLICLNHSLLVIDIMTVVFNEVTPTLLILNHLSITHNIEIFVELKFTILRSCVSTT